MSWINGRKKTGVTELLGQHENIPAWCAPLVIATDNQIRLWLIYSLFRNIYMPQRCFIIYQSLTLAIDNITRLAHLQTQLHKGSCYIYSYISFPYFTFSGVPYRIFLLFLPCHFNIVVIEQQLIYSLFTNIRMWHRQCNNVIALSYTLPDFSPASSLASLPFWSCCHRTATNVFVIHEYPHMASSMQ